MVYAIINSTKNKKPAKITKIPKSWNKSKQAYWSDIGKQAKKISYKKNRNTRYTDNPKLDGANRQKKYKFKLKVISKNGKTYTRYVYRKVKKQSTIRKYGF